MQSEFLQKLIALVAKSGHTMVVPDVATGKSYVVMDLPTYERLVEAGERSVDALTDPAPVAAPAVIPVPAPTSAPEPTAAINIAELVAKSTTAPEQTPEPPSSAARKETDISAKQSKNTATQQPQQAPPSGDLTQAELLDKINRDIGDWKTAQERRRADALRSAADRPDLAPADPQQPQRIVPPVFDEEERFYLEPIE